MSTLQTFEGFWINWSYGYYLGATLTLPQQTAGILAAFLALYVSFAGGMFWKILAFAIHQLNTTHPSKTNDWLHHKKQVLLKNSGSGSGRAAYVFLKLPFESSSSKASFKSVLRCLPLALLALATLVVFSVAGIFTSAITKTSGNSTLVLGPQCGGFLLKTVAGKINDQFIGKQLGDTKDAAQYVNQCYQNSTSRLACKSYVRPSLNFTTNENASCPFVSGTCRMGDTAAFSMDTGLLDSHVDFGINAPPENRVLFRRMATCAPIIAAPFAEIRNDSIVGETLYVNAGPYLGQNWTFSYIMRSQLDGFGYSLSSTYSTNKLANDTLSKWEPIPALNRTDADVTLFYLAHNSMVYLSPSNDPWIKASDPLIGGSFYGNPLTSLMGCIDQYQICNPTRSRETGCSKLGSMVQVLGINLGLDLNLHQLATAGRFMETGYDRTMHMSVRGRNAYALNAQDRAYGNIQQSLPNNQWHKEVSLWFSTSLAKEQAWAVEWATAPKNVDTSKGPVETRPFLTKESKAQCLTQLVRSTGGHVNFSVLGLIIILALGGLIIIVGSSIDTLVGWMRTRSARYKRDQWELEETLELHRAAYEALSFGTEGELPPSTIFSKKTALVKNAEEVAFIPEGERNREG
ncbi:hypothetical protein E6O75_ATG07896 [Venturia nashicola]|uniref:Uncharacterized protein n=1 Tax=Venturia nashicola TaxID=86259 RepID=A0A4Z1P266_9PEZI|nr:hypothetical protein E6O75_ATG07896 [Venturia nashicola]